MKYLLLAILAVLVTDISAQTKYHSSVTTLYNSVAKTVEQDREITISDTEIKISNFLGGKNTLNLKVNGTKEKPDTWGAGIVKWYYCVSTDWDVINEEYTEYVIIMKKSNPSNMTIYQKLDDVTFIKNVFTLK